jgi:hypothetical protein
MKKILLIISCAVLASFLGASAVQASWPDLSGVQDAVDNAVKAVAKAALQNKCKAIRTKIGSSSNTVNSLGKGNYDKFNEVSAKLDDAVGKAGENGYNINKLRRDTSTFKDYVNEYKKKYDYAQGSMKVAAMFAGCMNDPQSDINTMKLVISNSKNSMKEAKTLIKTTKNYYRDVIKADLFTLYEQKYVED